MILDYLIDLHIHTIFSDGTLSPSEIVNEATRINLRAIAITDHDTVDGIAEAEKAAEGLDLEIIPGIEISTFFNSDVHILGYYIDRNSTILSETLSAIVRERDVRNQRICTLMSDDGIHISYEEMKERFGDVIGRPHFARLLVESGMAETVQEGFRTYLNKGKRYFQPRSILSLPESIAVITRSGGVPVLAHPFQYRLTDSQLRELIEHCTSLGLKGLECRYSGYTEEQSSYLLNLAEQYHLIPTGGSDFHGSNKPQNLLGTGTGNLRVPYAWIIPLKNHEKKEL